METIPSIETPTLAFITNHSLPDPDELADELTVLGWEVPSNFTFCGWVVRMTLNGDHIGRMIYKVNNEQTFVSPWLPFNDDE